MLVSEFGFLWKIFFFFSIVVLGVRFRFDALLLCLCLTGPTLLVVPGFGHKGIVQVLDHLLLPACGPTLNSGVPQGPPISPGMALSTIGAVP